MAQKEPLPPRRVRMKRAGRLQSARKWLAKFRGKHVARAYSRWFGVNRVCAVLELRMLGVQLDPDYVRAVETTYRQKSLRTSRRPRKQDDPRGTYGIDYDDHFEFIAGHTEGAAAFGVTAEQWTDES